jgi:hypothetical protein
MQCVTELVHVTDYLDHVKKEGISAIQTAARLIPSVP